MDNRTNQTEQTVYVAPEQPFMTPMYGVSGSSMQRNLRAEQQIAVDKRKTKVLDALDKLPVGVLAIIAFVFGAVLCEMIFRGGFALGVVIVTLLFYGAFLPFILRNGKKVSLLSLAIAVPQLALVLSYAFNASKVGKFWLVLATFLMFMLQTSLLSGCADRRLTVGSAVDALYTHTLAPVENLGLVFKYGHSSDKKREKSSSMGNIGKVIIGLVISVPVVIVLLFVFMDADAAFAAEMDRLWKAIDLSRLDLGGLVIDIIVGALLSFYYVPLVVTLRSGYCREHTVKEAKRWLDPVIGATVAFASSLVYIAFVAVQFKYFFAVELSYYFDYDFSSKLSLPNDMTWAEYARSGFFELSGIIIATFIAIGLFMLVVKKNNGKMPLCIRIALTLLAVCNLAITASAVLRMRLYTIWCGFTAKRIAVLMIIGAFTLCLAAFVVKLWCEKLRLAPCVAVIAMLLAVTFGCMDVDAVCARANVSRYLDEGTSIDMYYLGELSYAAAPSVERLANEAPDDDIRSAALGLLAKYYYYGDGYGHDAISLKDQADSNRIGRWTLDHQRAYDICQKYDVCENSAYVFLNYAQYTRYKLYCSQNNYEAMSYQDYLDDNRISPYNGYDPVDFMYEYDLYDYRYDTGYYD